MKGVSFCTHYPCEYVKENRGRLVREEYAFFSGLREEIQSGAGLSRVLQHRERADLIFITAFRTGQNPDAGGYGYYSEGEKDFRGNTRGVGERVSRKDNRQQNKSLAQDIRRLGYGFIQVEGHYDGKEESYCVVNYVEDTDAFIRHMAELALKYKQDSILVVPKNEVPYLYKGSTGEKQMFKSASLKVLEDSVEQYTGIKGHKFEFQLSSGFWKDWDSLHPVRSGMSLMISTGEREVLDKEYNIRYMAGQMSRL